MAADTRINLELVLSGKGIKATAKDLKTVNVSLGQTAEKTKKVSNAANKAKRNMDGVAQRTGNSSKDFARMSQGLGGLVQAYATVAANVFALSSAFLVLRRSADLQSMIKSAENFSDRFGVSVTRITKQMQEASGGAISFAEALPIVNKAISAGIPIEKMERLTQAATKASQTFGGSATEALNRFISASQRGRVEIIQTLGIVIKTEQAYRDYAATIGKTAQELSAYDRQQAILNATITESENIFDQIVIDPNPFQQLATTLSDLKDTLLGIGTNVATPLLNFFNKSREAAGLLIVVLLRMVSSKIFPVLGERMRALQTASVASTSAALAAAKKSRRQLERFEKNQGKVVVGGGDPTKQLKKAENAFRASLGKRVKDHAAFAQKIINQDNTINAKALTAQRAAIKTQITYLERGQKGFKVFAGITKAELQQQLTLLNAIGGQIQGANVAEQQRAKATEQTTSALKRQQLAMRKISLSAKATSAQFTSLFVTGKARTFLGVQENIFRAIGDTGRAWGKFASDVGKFKGTSIITSFGRAAGRTAGLVSGLFQKAFGIATTVLVVVQLLQFAWEKWGDTILGVTPQQKAMNQAAEAFSEEMAEINARTAEGIVKLGENYPQSLKKLQDALKFTAGTFDSISNAINNLQKQTRAALNNLTVVETVERMKELEGQIEALQNKRAQLVFLDPGDRAALGKQLSDDIAAATKELDGFRAVLDDISSRSIDHFVIAVKQAIELAKDVGFSEVGALLQREFDSLNLELPGAVSSVGLRQALGDLDFDRVKSELKAIGEIMGKESPQFIALSLAVTQLGKNFTGTFRGLSTEIDQSLTRLADVNNRIVTFVGGLDKLRSASAPNKEIVGFVLDINRELSNLSLIQKGLTKNDRLANLFPDPKELAAVKSLLGFTADQVVDIGTAEERVKAIRGDLLNQQQQRLIISEKLKVLQIQQQELSSRQVRSDEARIQKVQEELDLQIKIAEAKRTLALADVTAQQRVIAAQTELGASDEVLQVERAKLDVYIAQYNSLNNQIGTLKDSTKVAETVLDITKQRIDAEERVLGIEKETAAIGAKNIGYHFDRAKLAKEQYNRQRRLNDLAIQDLEIQRARILVEQQEGELKTRNLAILDAQIAKQQAINAEYERRQGLIVAAQQPGVSIFSEDGLALAASFFIQKINEEASKLKSTIQILGEGFATTLNTAVDTMITNLLEGGRDFGQTMREGLKASLRDVFGEALASRIKEGIGDLFNITTAEGKAEARTAAIIQSQTLNKMALEANTRALLTKGAATPKLSGPMSPISTEAAKSQPGNKFLEEIAEKVSNPLTTQSPTGEAIQQETLAAGLLNVAAAADSKQGIIGAVMQLGSMLISAMSASGGGGGGGIWGAILGAFTGGGAAANGAVFKGGITPFQNGGMVNKPTLGLIGEGKNNEAVVPLPNNREIPVDLRGSGDTINIEQNFDFTNADTSAVPQLRAEARAIEDRTFNRVFAEINRGGRYAKMSGRRG